MRPYFFCITPETVSFLVLIKVCYYHLIKGLQNENNIELLFNEIENQGVTQENLFSSEGCTYILLLLYFS